MKKTYVIDTNVLLSDPNSLLSFQENDLIIPMVVLEELDNHKSRADEVGRNARQVGRTLDDMREKGMLAVGVKLPNGGTLKVASIPASSQSLTPPELQKSKVDNMIIAFMLSLKDDSILVSKDINVRLKCDGLGIKCEDYLKMRVTDDTRKFYRGVEVVELQSDLIDLFYKEGLLDASVVKEKIYPNEIVVIKHVVGEQTIKSAITRCEANENGAKLVPVKKIESVYGLAPRNKEQTFSLDLLLNKNIKLVTLTGPSGCGKTLLALAAGLHQLKTLGKFDTYERIIVTKPIQPVGREIGFLPGTLEEKMEPWIAPIRDNLNHLMGDTRRRKSKTDNDEPYLSLMIQRGLIEIEAITFIRGRSIPNSFIVIDEAQNLSMHELKTIITRVGDGTKIVLTGDIEQIDNVHVDVYTNGLTYAIEKFKEHDIAAHVTLLRGERSPLATLASKIL